MEKASSIIYGKKMCYKKNSSYCASEWEIALFGFEQCMILHLADFDKLRIKKAMTSLIIYIQ